MSAAEVCRDCGSDLLPPSAYKFRQFRCGQCVMKRRAARGWKPKQRADEAYIATAKTCRLCGQKEVPSRLKARYIILCDDCHRQQCRRREKPYTPVADLADEDRQKLRARRLLRNRVFRGQIEKQPCEVCGAANTHGHHEDYHKPLEVRWLCPVHHNLLHASQRKENPNVVA